MHSEAQQQAAQIIADHRLTRRPLPALDPSVRPDHVDVGYSIQALTNERLSRAGLGATAGHKVGATNPILQRRLKVPHPVAGAVFATTVHQKSAPLRHADYVRPGVECEVVFLLGQDLPSRATAYAREEIEAVIAAIAAGMEIIDDRYVDVVNIGAPTLIADNALDAAVIIGEFVNDWRELSLPTRAATTVVNGAVAGQGTGADVMGDPINVLLWLANDFSRRGLGLKSGEFIFTGSMVDIIWIKPGDEVVTEVEGLGRVQALFR